MSRSSSPYWRRSISAALRGRSRLRDMPVLSLARAARARVDIGRTRKRRGLEVGDPGPRAFRRRQNRRRDVRRHDRGDGPLRCSDRRCQRRHGSEVCWQDGRTICCRSCRCHDRIAASNGRCKGIRGRPRRRPHPGRRSGSRRAWCRHPMARRSSHLRVRPSARGMANRRRQRRRRRNPLLRHQPDRRRRVQLQSSGQRGAVEQRHAARRADRERPWCSRRTATH